MLGLALASVGVFVPQCAAPRHPRHEIAAPAPPAPTPPADAFRGAVQPMLARRCGPCHAPGGKMYGTMPFDDPGVVRSHEDGILRRIKEPADRDPLIAWLRSPSPPPR